MQNLSTKAPATYQYELSRQLTALELGTVSKELQGLAKSGCQCLILDGNSVEEVDIAGLNMLIKVYKAIMSLNGSMIIRLKKNGKLADMLHITKYDKWFQLKYSE
jgi:anti-anti-sigma regulatory factor